MIGICAVLYFALRRTVVDLMCFAMDSLEMAAIITSDRLRSNQSLLEGAQGHSMWAGLLPPAFHPSLYHALYITCVNLYK